MKLRPDIFYVSLQQIQPSKCAFDSTASGRCNLVQDIYIAQPEDCGSLSGEEDPLENHNSMSSLRLGKHEHVGVLTHDC